MKKTVKWLYLILSGISFLLVLCLIALCGYAYIADDQVKILVEDFQEYRAYNKNEKIFEVIDFDDTLNTSYSISKNNKLANGDDPKLKIKTKGGYAYLRPSQIYYIEAGNEYHTIVAINNKVIKLNKRETPLKDISSLLNGYSCFYTTKSYILNCLYIEQIDKSEDFRTSKKVAVMENGKAIQIPESHVAPLLKKLDEFHQTN